MDAIVYPHHANTYRLLKATWAKVMIGPLQRHKSEPRELFSKCNDMEDVIQKKLKMTILVHKERLNVGDESQSVNLLMFTPHSAPHDDSKPCPTYIPLCIKSYHMSYILTVIPSP